MFWFAFNTCNKYQVIENSVLTLFTHHTTVHGTVLAMYFVCARYSSIRLLYVENSIWFSVDDVRERWNRPMIRTLTIRRICASRRGGCCRRHVVTADTFTLLPDTRYLISRFSFCAAAALLLLCCCCLLCCYEYSFFLFLCWRNTMIFLWLPIPVNNPGKRPHEGTYAMYLEPGARIRKRALLLLQVRLTS